MSNGDKTSVLIVDDQDINRMILKNILSSEYEIFEAENGMAALELLDGHKRNIGAVLLDLIMPVMDGFEFLNAIRKPAYASLPVIVLTGEANSDTEKKVLEEGAWDFITKPYQPVILMTRLKNAIARSRMGLFDQMKMLAEHDSLTGLYNRSHFFEMTRKMLDSHPDMTFAFIRMDLDRFSMINAFWGEEEGDHLLRYAADCLRKESRAFLMSTYSRINSDIFCFCAPFDETAVLTMVDSMRQTLLRFKKDYYIKPTFGIYVIREPEQSVESIYEKAAIASKFCKGIYNRYIGYYDREAHDETQWEQYVIRHMHQALKDGQFVPWLQPKYSLKSETPCGAEALVRWNHPDLGVLLPGKFISIFERNGFISRIDCYVWDSVCRMLRGWMDEGREPFPISVNVSLIDLYNPNIVQILCDMVKKYNIPAGLLNLELTESVYMDNPSLMNKIMKNLHENGFIIMMDDFGSGYSSLNTLKEIPVDILKIDMGFLSDADKSTRSRKILASMILMAGWIDLPVIVEGVETRQQVDFLKSIGCNYVQGYYFGKPMPADDYHALVSGQASSVPLCSSGNHELIDMVWETSGVGNSFIYSLSFPAAIYEFYNHRGYPLRVNERLNETLGQEKRALRFDGDNTFFEKDDVSRFLDACESMGQEHDAESFRMSYRNADGKLCPVNVMLSFMGSLENRKILSVFFALNSGAERGADGK
jgi:diguanylate cyclase (GGDEF)-like protein